MDYKKILEGVVNIINTTEKSDIGFANICSYIGENCPELKESEDERIRKVLVGYFKGYKEVGTIGAETFNGIPTDNIIAWLEKKGEQKQELLTKEKALKNSPFVEQKPADKVEPKFKVGDWVVHDMSDGRVSPPTQIVDMTNKSYVFDTEQCFYFSDAEEIFRKWTIQDAKDGDVLAGADNIIIYGGYINNYGDRIGNKAILAYCGWNGEQLVINKKKKEGFGGIGYVPATKEQRDLLLQKMHEAGYEWDAEKKEPKEIEKNPAWSEEDDNCLINAINVCEINDYNETADWLKDLKDRVQPQPMQEWSALDERNLQGVIDEIQANKNKAPDYDLETYDRFLNWLKSLRPQSQWKPSEEQIEALEHFVRNIAESGFASPYDSNTKLVCSLFKDLKKLREE